MGILNSLLFIMRKRDFKLVLIGDGTKLIYLANVGKSTFVSALINEDPSKSTRVTQHPPVQLPPEMFQNPECNTILYDTHCQPHQIPEEVN
jgi:GTPase SAR1 family protein